MEISRAAMEEARARGMELATVAGALAALWRYRLPFLVLPLAVTLLYLGLDLTPRVYGEKSGVLSAQGGEVSMVVGMAMTLLAVAVAVAVDLRWRRRPDYAFWLYLSGALRGCLPHAWRKLLGGGSL